MSTTVAMNLAGVVEEPGMSGNPYLVDADGHPYLPVGDGGVELGDGVVAFAAEHPSPAVSLVHPEQAARHALTASACLGDPVTVLGDLSRFKILMYGTTRATGAAGRPPGSW